ncbi:MAG: RHS repeat-associated core domain-containing protein [Opitutaceae bacterium]|nr:RHS repeat-associated core domain-containing protein [Opitutaceae bacterium]
MKKILWFILAGASCLWGDEDDVLVSIRARAQWVAGNFVSNNNTKISIESGAMANDVSLAAKKVEFINPGGSSVNCVLPQLNTRFVPETTYTLNVNYSNGSTPPPNSNGSYIGWTSLRIEVCAPPGYGIEVNGQPTSYGHATIDTGITSGLSKIKVKLVSYENSSGQAGIASSLSTDRNMFVMPLGELPNGMPAGTISISNKRDKTTVASMFDLENVDVTQGGTPVVKLGATTPLTGPVKQVASPQVGLDFRKTTGANWEIWVYHRSGFSDVVGASGYYTITGNPFAKYYVYPAATSTKAEIKCEMLNLSTGAVARTLWTTLERTGTGPNFTWTATPWTDQGSAPLVRDVRTISGTTETLQTLDSSNNILRSTTRVKRGIGSGSDLERLLADELVSETSAGETTTYEIYTDSTLGNFGRVYKVVAPGGSWTGFQYNTESGVIDATHTPFLDSAFPASLSSNTTGARAANTMVQDLLGQRIRPTLVEGYFANIKGASTSFTYVDPDYNAPTNDKFPFRSLTDANTAGVHLVGLVQQTATQATSASASLVTITRTFAENSGIASTSPGTAVISGNDPSNDFFRNLPHSVKHPNDVQQSFVYQRGSWNGSAFTASLAAGSSPYQDTNYTFARASRICVITGSRLSTAGSYQTAWSGYPIEPIYLVTNKSTMEVTIRDAFARTVRTESHVWNGTAFEQVAWKTFSYNSANQNTGWTDSTGKSYSAVYVGGRLDSETAPDGSVTSYSYDVIGRVTKVTRSAASAGGLSAIATKTTYGGNSTGALITATVSSNPDNASIEALTTTTQYDKAGRVISQTLPGQGTTTITYDSAARKVTTSRPLGMTQIEEHYLDGQPRTVSGTAVIRQDFVYGIGADGNRWTRVNLGGSGVRGKTTWVDWAGREVKTDTAAPPNVVPANIQSEKFYDTKGRCIKITQSGMKDVLFEFGPFSEVVRQGVDMDGSGTLVTSSSDRITDTLETFEKSGSNWWLKTVSSIYPLSGNGTAFQASVSRKRVSGLTLAVNEEVEQTDIEGNTTNRKVAVDTANQKTTITTTTPGVAGSIVEVAYHGLIKSVTAPDLNVTSTTYDQLRRRTQVTDARSNTITTAYHPGTTLPSTVTQPISSTESAVSSFFYDEAGRVVHSRDAQNRDVRTEYTARSEVFRQWGSGTYPVEYTYDIYGARETMRTFRSIDTAAWNAATWPNPAPAAADGSRGDVTTWVFDPASGVLTSKKDAANRSVAYTYNNRGQMLTRTSARGLTTTYVYDSVTADLRNVNYSGGTDAFGVQLAPANLAYGYDRNGRVTSVTDASGTRTFDYTDSSKPWRLIRENLPAYFGSRKMELVYEEVTAPQAAGGYAGYTAHTLKGRARGYKLLNGATVEQNIQYTSNDKGRLVGASVGSVGDFIYRYETNGLFSKVENGSYKLERTYDSKRALLTSVKSSWSTSIVTQFDYLYNTVGQRRYMAVSGTAFADYGGTTHRAYRYNDRGELVRTAAYNGALPAPSNMTSSDADTGWTLSTELPGRRYEYTYDEIGNRVTAGTSNQVGRGEFDSYESNNLNQYTQRENRFVRVTGTVAAGGKAAVKSAGTTNATDGLAAPVNGRAFGALLKYGDNHAEVNGSVDIFGAILGTAGGADKVQKITKQFPLAKHWQVFLYDSDGNMISDGQRDYSYDHENRLIRVKTNAAGLLSGLANQTITFTYDYMGRRIRKAVDTGGTQDVRVFVYSGWNQVAELSSGGGLLRRFAWGLDLTGSLSAAGGIGGLLQIEDIGSGKTYLPTYDANGNVAALLDKANGAVAAIYEYGAFGELLRCEGAYAKQNPFRFSTKWHDDETRLVYYGHRYYSPDLGRFINRDPIAEQGGLNLYGFCGNDGVDRWDYLGQSWLSKAFRKIGKWVKRNWTSIVSVALNFIPGIGPALSAIFSSAVGYYYGGVKGMLMGWAASAIGGNIVGRIPGLGNLSGFWGTVAKGAIGGVVNGGVAAGLSGGSIWEGMVAGATTGAVLSAGAYAYQTGAIGRAARAIGRGIGAVAGAVRTGALRVGDLITGRSIPSGSVSFGALEAAGWQDGDGLWYGWNDQPIVAGAAAGNASVGSSLEDFTRAHFEAAWAAQDASYQKNWGLRDAVVSRFQGKVGAALNWWAATAEYAANMAMIGFPSAGGSATPNLGSKSFFEGTKYTTKVLRQMEGGAGEFHSFPRAVEAFENSGTVRWVRGGDNVVRDMLEIPGSYGGRDGAFQFIKNADGTINHRLFVPGGP